MTPPDQLPLPLLPVRTARGREDFFVSPANALAVAIIDGWQLWPAGKCLLTGPTGSGKTHLAQVWAQSSGARIVPADGLGSADIPTLATAPVCIENAETIAGDRGLEEALFHLHNLALAQAQPMLITARTAPALWGLILPDLHSRMMGTQMVRLEDPDDALLSALLTKLFSDRQITPAPEVLSFLVKHMPRSHRAAAQIVAELDAAGLAKQGAVTRPLAVAVMARLALDGAEAHNG
jgi:chromosomal replication initiation ATPase DnaA